MESAPYDAEKDLIKIGSETPLSRAQYLRRMRGFVEDYNFDEYYSLKSLQIIRKQLGNPSDSITYAFKQTTQSELSYIKLKEQIYNRRHLNFV